ncbi:MAG: LruC domain-containing protein [Moritella sp.]|uniref:LruC domain-containing protein n=1 Tax=Moritella sp. TaxID=78556 RepID=UPI00216FAEE1|nr:LruC domain-containing protein [Moritella sp.]MBL1418228.1 LruC domain-containing protein [Moritella sp.]
MLNIKKYSDVPLFTLLLMTSLLSVSVNAEPILQSQLANDDTKSFANFGTSVAVTESFIVVGTPGKQSDQGEACVFLRNQSTWSMMSCLDPISDTMTAIKQFGSVVAISDQSVIIGGKLQGGLTGAVYIFKYENGNWNQQREMTKPGATGNDFFGQSVSISGDLAAIASPGSSNDDGAVYVYKRTGSNWILNTTIIPDSEFKSKQFGAAVSIYEGYLIIGDGESGKTKEGSAYIYKYDDYDDTWTKQATLKGGLVTRAANYALSVAISKDYAVIGARMENDPHGNNEIKKGAVYVYKRKDNVWMNQAKLTANAGLSGDQFGNSVAIVGEHIVIGAENMNSSSGAVVLFKLVDDVWQEQSSFIAADGASQDNFGHAVGVSESYVTVGAHNKKIKKSLSGDVYVYALNVQTQQTQAEIDLEITLATLNNPSAEATVNPDDLDGDGLSNSDETYILNTSPTDPDTDNDGLTDFEEVTIYGTDPLSSDTDQDTLTDLEEIIFYNSDPTLIDTDEDGFSDEYEVNVLKTDPGSMDTDGDGLLDQVEVNELATDPTLADTDGDGLTDNEELNLHLTDPLDADSDNDNFSDGLEVNYYDTSPLEVADVPVPLVTSTAYSPSENQMGTMAFEDYWPSKGDYDFNDVVINYNAEETKVDGQISKIILKLQPVARGASYKNALQISINTPITNIASATMGPPSNAVPLTPIADGNQTMFVIIGDIEDALPAPKGFKFANTESNSPKVTGSMFTVTINLKNPVDENIFGSAPYNTFISRKLGNGEVIEVHFPGYRPTKFASKRQFGTGHDDTDKSTDKYYQTKDNLPWAMIIPQLWEHPKEKVDLSQDYPEILDWASSRGKSKKDWYKNKKGKGKAK